MTTVWCWKHAPSSFFFLLWKIWLFPTQNYTPETILSVLVFMKFHPNHWIADGKKWFLLQVTLRLEPSGPGPSQRLPDKSPWCTMCLFNLLVLFIPQDRLWVPKWSKLKYGENRTTISENICRRLDSRHAVGLAKSADASLPEFSSGRVKWYWTCLEGVGLDESFAGAAGAWATTAVYHSLKQWHYINK